MEIIRSYELAEEGTIGVCGGMAMCASCQVYVINDPDWTKWVLKKMPC
jgi:2Fe-2S ferredoxin